MLPRHIKMVKNNKTPRHTILTGILTFKTKQHFFQRHTKMVKNFLRQSVLNLTVIENCLKNFLRQNGKKFFGKVDKKGKNSCRIFHYF